VSRLETEIEEKKKEFQSVSSDVATIQATIKLQWVQSFWYGVIVTQVHNRITGAKHAHGHERLNGSFFDS